MDSAAMEAAIGGLGGPLGLLGLPALRDLRDLPDEVARPVGVLDTEVGAVRRRQDAQQQRRRVVGELRVPAASILRWEEARR